MQNLRPQGLLLRNLPPQKLRPWNLSALSVAMMILWCAIPCGAQLEGRNHIITGRVIDSASHEPLAGVSVRLMLGGAKLAEIGRAHV